MCTHNPTSSRKPDTFAGGSTGNGSGDAWSPRSSSYPCTGTPIVSVCCVWKSLCSPRRRSHHSDGHSLDPRRPDRVPRSSPPSRSCRPSASRIGVPAIIDTLRVNCLRTQEFYRRSWVCVWGVRKTAITCDRRWSWVILDVLYLHWYTEQLSAEVGWDPMHRWWAGSVLIRWMCCCSDLPHDHVTPIYPIGMGGLFKIIGRIWNEFYMKKKGLSLQDTHDQRRVRWDLYPSRGYCVSLGIFKELWKEERSCSKTNSPVWKLLK